MKDVQILGVDLGKNSCSVVGLDAAGHVLLRRRMRREGVVALAAKLPGCVVAMEACCGAHHLGRLLAARGPVSSRCSVIDDGGLAADLLGSGTWPIAYDAALNVVIVHEVEDDTLVLVDVAAPRMPSAARILGALGARPARLRTLFPPDRLEWTGVPVADDTGLMVRGPLPPAMRLPFMLPPTAGF